MNNQKVQPSAKQNKGAVKQAAMAYKEEIDYSKYFLPSILIITAIVFANSLQNDFIINWDDQEYVINNPLIKHLNWEHLKEIFYSFQMGNYHPLTMLSYAIEYKLFGLNPFYFHLTNYIFHLLNVALVYLLIKQLSGNSLVAFITSVFFAIHPMHVESVSWISERKDVLYSFFFLLSLYTYSKYVLTEKKNRCLLWSFLWFSLSLLSKPAAVCLPLVLLLIDYYLGNKISVKSVLSKTPFFILSLIFGIIAIIAQKSSGAIIPIGPDINISDRIFMFSYSIFYYLFKVFFPFNLSAIHFYPIKSGSFLPFEYYLSLLVLILVIWVAIKSKILRKEIFFGISLYFITIVMVLQIIPLGMAIVSERYSYIPYIGIFFIWGHFYSIIMSNKIQVSSLIKKLLPFILAFIIVMSGLLTYERNKIWRNGFVLFSDVIVKYPEYKFGWFVRGYNQSDRGNYPGALTDYNKSFKLYPTNAPFDFDIYYGRGFVNEKMNNFESALADYSKSILLKPDYVNAWLNRGILNARMSRYNESLNDYNKAMELDSINPAIFFNRGTLFLLTANYGKALAEFSSAIRLNPDYSDAYSNRGATFAYLNKMDESLAEFNKAIEINPNSAETYFSRGFTKLSLKDKDGACRDWSKSLQLGYANAENALSAYCK
jgi:protein O-mannosyl-transferase